MQWKDDIQNSNIKGSGLRWIDDPNAINNFNQAIQTRKQRQIINGVDPALSKVKQNSVPQKALRIFNIASDAAQKDATLGLGGEGGPIDKLASKITTKITGKDTSKLNLIPEPETKTERFAKGAGEFIGATVPIAPISKLGGLLPKVPGKGLTSKAINSAIQGGVAGAVYEGAQSAIEGDTMPEIAKNAGKGALLWGGIEAGLPVVGTGLKTGLGKLQSKGKLPGFNKLKTQPEKAADISESDVLQNLNLPFMPKGMNATGKLPGTQTRGLSNTVSKLKWIDKGVKTGLEQEAKEGGRGTYNPITNPDTLEQAKQLLNQDTDAVTRRILSNEPASATDNAAGMLLVQKAQDAGDYSKAVDLIESMAKKATEQGQAIQALSMWGRLTPEGMLQYGQKIVNRANAQDRLMGGAGKRFKMTPETAEKVTTYMKQAEGLEGRARDIKVAQALDEIAGQIPSSILRKVSTIQTMAQLLNPKTGIRNVVGNLGFQGLENASDIIGTGLDKGLGLFTGNRTKVLPSLMTQAKGMGKGAKQGLEDAVLGIDTSNMAGGKFDLPTTRTFRKGPLSWAEKAMNIGLRATDRAFYQAAYDESLRQQMAAASKSGKAVSEPTEAMQEMAHHDALYRTFQDDNALSNAFRGIKRALNFGKEFGIGDFVLKYPKTPANLLARGLEYSPAGLVKTIMEASKPLMGKTFNQKAFVESFSRAVVGSTTGVGTGAVLHHLGLITGGGSDDKDVAALESQAGFGQYRLNVSGLKRFVMGGLNPEDAKIRKGDITVSYDWFQPWAIPLAIGADIDANKGQAKGIAGTLVNAFTTGINAFADQPVVQGLQTLFGQREPADAIPAILEGVPASFVPTLLNQVKQLVDNQKRNTYDPNFKNEMLNRAKNRIPGMAGQLPQAYGTLGQKRTTYQEGDGLTSNNAFNVFFNPAFINKYAPTKEAQMVIDIYKNTGETSQVPRVIAKYFNVSGQKIDLTAAEYSDMQKQVGELTREGFSKIPTKLSDEDKLKAMGTVMTDAGQEARITVLENRGIPLPASWMEGAGYLIRAINKGDTAKAKSYTAKNSANNAFKVYEYGQKHGMVDEQGNPDKELTKALSEVWSAQTEGQSKTAALNFLLDACENGKEQQAQKWAQVVKQTGLTQKEIQSRIKQKAKSSETGAKTPTIEQILQGGYDITPDTLKRLWWAMGY